MAPKEQSSSESILQLPMTVVTKVDLGRLMRELDTLENFMQQSAIREPGTPVKLPKTSRLFDETINNNKLNMLHEDDRKRLIAFLQEVKLHAPVLHMSFGADPSPLFTQKLVAWLRSELHPLILLQVGLQPNIGAGCVVRTTNKYFDFSLRNRFTERRAELTRLMKAEVAT